MSENPVYYNYYRRCINELLHGDQKDTIELMNPHLGRGWHLRGTLPYISEAKERECDEKLMKAFLYMIMAGEIKYDKPRFGDRGFYTKDGNPLTVLNNERKPVIVDENYLSRLITWLRPQETLIDEWSKKLDSEIEDQIGKIPTAEFDDDMQETLSRINRSAYIVKMSRNLFVDIINATDASEREYAKKNISLGLFELYNKIRLSEANLGEDLNDAEKLIRCAYKIVCRFCNRGANKEAKRDLYAVIHNHEIEWFFEEFAKDEDMGGKIERINSIQESIYKIAKEESFRVIKRFDGDKVEYDEYRVDSAKLAKKEAKKEEAPAAPVEATDSTDDGDNTDNA